MDSRHSGFESSFLDFERGIRVGHLEPHQRITQILKRNLQRRFKQDFVVDRFGRGVYWQWICFLPRANRSVKPISNRRNFASSKFFIMVDRAQQLFKTGLQVERGFLEPPPQWESCRLADDWDWNQLIARLEGPLYQRIRRFCRTERFHIFAGSWDSPHEYSPGQFPSRGQLVEALVGIAPGEWSAFQLYYPMKKEEVERTPGDEMVEAIMAIFCELTPIMNEIMSVRLD